MSLLLLLLAWVDAQVALLGSDDWGRREAAAARLSTPLLAPLLPAASEDAEANARLADLRRRHGWWLDPVRTERRALARDPAAWVRLYPVAGRSAIAEEYGTFERVHGDRGAATEWFRAWRPLPGCGEGFLRGPIHPGEYETYREYLDYHRRVAPMPREVRP